MELLATFKHANCYPVSWAYNGVQHRITYGTQTRVYYHDIEACHEFGECVRHALECAGKFSNQ